MEWTDGVVQKSRFGEDHEKGAVAQKWSIAAYLLYPSLCCKGVLMASAIVQNNLVSAVMQRYVTELVIPCKKSFLKEIKASLSWIPSLWRILKNVVNTCCEISWDNSCYRISSAWHRLCWFTHTISVFSFFCTFFLVISLAFPCNWSNIHSDPYTWHPPVHLWKPPTPFNV